MAMDVPVRLVLTDGSARSGRVVVTWRDRDLARRKTEGDSSKSNLMLRLDSGEELRVEGVEKVERDIGT